MPVEIDWFVENHIIDYRLKGIVSSNDMIAVGNLVAQMVESNPITQVHVLYDVRECKKIPYDIPNIVKAVRPYHNVVNMGWAITFGSMDPVTQFTERVIVGLLKVNYRNFQSRREALEFLAVMDSGLMTVASFLDRYQTEK